MKVFRSIIVMFSLSDLHAIGLVKWLKGGLSRRNSVVSSSQERGHVGHAHKPVDILSMSCISRRPRT